MQHVRHKTAPSGAPPHAGKRTRPGGPRRVRAGLVALLVLGVLAAVAVRIGPQTVDAVHRLLEARQAPAVPAPVAPVAMPEPTDPLADVPAVMRAALTAAETRAGQPFRFMLAVPPAEICAAMAGEGLANPGWQLAGEEWECASDLVPLPGSVPRAPDPADLPEGIEPVAQPSTLFFVARGPAEDRLAVIRFKLNLDDPAVERDGREALVAALDRLSGPLAWSAPAEVVSAIRRHEKLSAFDRGIAVEVHPETGPVERLNVVLVLETPAARLPTDRFEKLPPALAEDLVR